MMNTECNTKSLVPTKWDPLSNSKVSPKIATSFEYRCKLGDAIRAKHPDRFPMIVEINHAGNLAKRKVELTKSKFLVPHDATAGSFMTIFKHGHFLTGLDSHEAIYFFFGDRHLVTNSSYMGELYDQYKEDDGFLYSKVDVESSFG
jgi:GABA(A) receptor-associated protein